MPAHKLTTNIVGANPCGRPKGYPKTVVAGLRARPQAYHKYCRGEPLRSPVNKEKIMKILLVSLGCNKNLVDSEMILGALVKNGHEITLDENDADYIIINTCAFINDAKEESINKIIGVLLWHIYQILK